MRRHTAGKLLVLVPRGVVAQRLLEAHAGSRHGSVPPERAVAGAGRSVGASDLDGPHAFHAVAHLVEDRVVGGWRDALPLGDPGGDSAFNP